VKKINWKEFVGYFKVYDDEGCIMVLETTVRFGSHDMDGNAFPVPKIAFPCAKLVTDVAGCRRDLYGLNVFALLTPKMHEELKRLALLAALDRFEVKL
jgi:hypothetical protein